MLLNIGFVNRRVVVDALAALGGQEDVHRLKLRCETKVLVAVVVTPLDGRKVQGVLSHSGGGGRLVHDGEIVRALGSRVLLALD